MTNKPLPRIVSALLVGAFAVVPVAASVAVAPSAVAIEPLAVVADADPANPGDAEFLDVDGNAVDHAPEPTDLTAEELAQIAPLSEDGDTQFLDEDGNAVDHAPEPTDLTAEELARIQPISAEIAPISADTGLPVGAIVAIVTGGLVVVGGGVTLGLRARSKAAKA
jgi:hypothetical protein